MTAIVEISDPYPQTLTFELFMIKIAIRKSQISANDVCIYIKPVFKFFFVGL